MPSHRVIIDTDPGVDDILALLLALAATPEELEVALISVTFGNTGVEDCLANVVSMFHIIDQELEWRRKHGKSEGFASLRKFKPIVAVGAGQPLENQKVMADFFHGQDGLGGIRSSHPHLNPPETWKAIFSAPPTNPGNSFLPPVTPSSSPLRPLPFASDYFTPSAVPAHVEILRILENSPPSTVSIIAIGPLTSIALASAESPATFLRVKQVLVMGGAIDSPGNITPVAEFNTFADPVAAARVYALTSPNPPSTLPPAPPPRSHTPNPPFLGNYDLRETSGERLNVKLFPLDITTRHLLTRGEVRKTLQPLVEMGSPLAEWVTVILESIYRKIETLGSQRRGKDFVGEKVGLSLHDPLCIWYALCQDSNNSWAFVTQDIRVETTGQWTRGMCVADRRGRNMLESCNDVGDFDMPGDNGRWLSSRVGNRLQKAVKTPGEEIFGKYLLERIFG